MLFDFARDARPELSVDECQELSKQMDMSIVNDKYKEQIKSPLWNIMLGRLVRMMLIKIQGLEQDLMMEKQEIDVLLRRNQFNLQLMATVPAFLVGASALWLFSYVYSVVRAALAGAVGSWRQHGPRLAVLEVCGKLREMAIY